MVSWGEGQEKKIPQTWWCSRWRWDDKDNLQNALAMVVIERYLRKLKRNAMNENPTKRPRGANGGGEGWLKDGEGWNGLSMTACSLAPSRSRPSSIISIFKFHSFKLSQPLETPLKMRLSSIISSFDYHEVSEVCGHFVCYRTSFDGLQSTWVGKTLG